MNLAQLLEDRGPRLKAMQEDLKGKGAEFALVHLPEMAGIFRSKLTPFKLGHAGEALNAILYCTMHGDGMPLGDVVFDAPVATAANGYPNIVALADPDSVRQHGWDRRFVSVVVDSFGRDGAPCGLNPRAALARQAARLAALGIEAKVALEYEFGIFHADHDLMRAGRYSELKPWGHSLVNYDLVRSGELVEFFATFMKRLESIGIGVSSIVTEYGYGMYEFALSPKPPVEAADDAMRAKLHLKELCAERGLVATFMTRFQPPGKESACGAHHHVSLWRDGENLLAADVDRVTETGSRFLAGVLHRLAETHLVFRPTVNSYRRFDRGAWSPEDVSWGFENRMAAVRTITTPTPEAARIEHRVAGADVNPYLTTAAILAAGAEGLERERALPEACPGDPVGRGGAPLPRTLRQSVEAFRASDFVRDAFGDELARHYADGRAADVQAFEAWQAARITEFEWQRYFVGA